MNTLSQKNLIILGDFNDLCVDQTGAERNSATFHALGW